jgi:hypothetical protein
MTLIGGAQRDERLHAEYREEPLWAKYLALPFAIAAAPFKRAAEALRGEREPGPEVPRATPSAPSVVQKPPPDYETSSLRSLERELQERQAREPVTPVGAGPSTPLPSGAPPGASTAPTSEPSIAEELAALRRAATARSSPAPEPAPPLRVASAHPTEAAVTRPAPPPALAEAAPAHGIVDRNGDGRTDHWIYRETGEITREVFDDDFDGRPDRALLYDLETHQVHRVEEDTDRDGAFDSWTDYRDGSVVRRRSDSDSNGGVDSWSYYAGGRITRYEQDTTGDGFRDRVGVYRDGRLEREEFDRDGDGRLDRILHYDANEQVIREEQDSDRDGRVDVISHYDSGRLARRELLDPSLLRSPGGAEGSARGTAAP